MIPKTLPKVLNMVKSDKLNRLTLFVLLKEIFLPSDFISLCELQVSKRLDETRFRGGGRVSFYTGKKVQDI